MNMQNVLEAIELLDRNKLAPDAVAKLIAVALDLATRLNRGLDMVNLPRTEQIARIRSGVRIRRYLWRPITFGMLGA